MEIVFFGIAAVVLIAFFILFHRGWREENEELERKRDFTKTWDENSKQIKENEE